MCRCDPQHQSFLALLCTCEEALLAPALRQVLLTVQLAAGAVRANFTLPFSVLHLPALHTGAPQEDLLLIWALLTATVIITYLIQRFRVTWLPPSAAALVLGALCGIGIKIAGARASGKSDAASDGSFQDDSPACDPANGCVAGPMGLAKPFRFSPSAFFYGLLPPIVFAAGFNLKKVTGPFL